jgi:SET domain-containing protein
MSQHQPSLYITTSPLGGRGVFSAAAIAAGEIIEICQLILLSPEDLALIHRTKLHDYYFLWGQPEGSGAIALGYGSLYNHSHQPNAYYHMDKEWETIDIIALRDITAGEEITFNYNGDPDDHEKIWFEKD